MHKSSTLKPSYSSLKGPALLFVPSLAASLAALVCAPQPHPYLLADNRHFTFYVWRRFLAPRVSVGGVCVCVCVSIFVHLHCLALVLQEMHGRHSACSALLAWPTHKLRLQISLVHIHIYNLLPQPISQFPITRHRANSTWPTWQ